MMCNVKSMVVFVFVVGMMFAIGSNDSSAVMVIENQDVSCETYAWNGNIAQSNIATGYATFGQTWTTGAAVDNLSKIKILTMREQGVNVTTSTLGDLTCTIYSSVGGTMLGSSAVARDSVPTAAASFPEFLFSSPLVLSPSTQYYFELSATGGYIGAGDDADRYTEFHGLDVDAGGQIYHDRIGDWANADTWFDTYYVVPEPATMSLLLLGAVSLIGRKRQGM